MKIGANLWIWESPFRSSSHLHLFAKVKALGGDVVEFGLEDDAVVEARSVRQALRDYELGCSLIGLFGPQRDLSSPEPEVRRAGMEYARRCIDVAGEIGAAIYSGAVIGVGGTTLLSTEDRQARLQHAADCLQELGDRCGERGILFCVEILNRYESNLMITAQEAVELVALVPHPAVGIHLDTFHMNIEEPSAGEAIRIAGDKLFHLHGSESHRSTPGEGHVPWMEVAAALTDVKYDRFVVLEAFNSAGRLAPLARVWRRHDHSPDTMARKGMAFLRQMLCDERKIAHST